MLSLSGSLLNSSLGKCSQWPDFGFHYKNFLLTPFSFDSEQRWGCGRRFGEQSWLLLYRIGCVFFQVGPLGKCSSESSLRVSDGKGYVLYILPVKAQTMFENSSGKSHGARGSWKQWNCDLGIVRTLYFKLYYKCETCFFIWIAEGEPLHPHFFVAYMSSEIGACELTVLVPWEWASLAHIYCYV